MTIGTAALVLATLPGRVGERLASAMHQVGMLHNDEFPDDETRDRWRSIEGRTAATAPPMTEEEATAVAKDLFELAVHLRDRC